MSKKSMTILEKLIDKGLENVMKSTERNIQKKLQLIDQRGQEHFPNKISVEQLLFQYHIEAMDIEEKRYFYDDAKKSLVFLTGRTEFKAYIIVDEIELTEISYILEELQELDLAMKYYMNSVMHIEENLMKYQTDFVQSICIKSDLQMEEIARKAGIHLNPENQYAVALLKPAKQEKCFEPRNIKASLFQFANQNRLKYTIPIYYNGFFVLILINTSVEEQMTLQEDSLQLNKYRKWKSLFEEKYKVQMAMCVGGIHMLNDISKSYNEARVAYFFHSIKGEVSFMQNFMELGVFTYLFSQETTMIQRFCLRVIGEILKYDHDYDTKLVATLRVLLESNFNWKLSSSQLFVHVNTLRYRYDKIEQILEKDLARSDVRANLFIAIKASDILEKMGLMRLSYEETAQCVSGG